MADEMEQGERTFEPTPLRLAEARRRGQVVRSHELTASLLTLGGLGALAVLGPTLLKALVGMTAAMLDGGAAARGDLATMAMLNGSCLSLVWPVAALAGSIIVLAVLVNLAQVGLPKSTEQVKADWRRVSIVAGMERLWSVRTLQRGAMLLVRLIAVGAAAYFTIRATLPRIAAAGRIGVGNLPAEAGSLLWQLAWRAGLAMLAIGAMDYLYQRWQHRRDLRISHSRLRDDLRQMEGPPKVRGKGRRAAGAVSCAIDHMTPNLTGMNNV